MRTLRKISWLSVLSLQISIGPLFAIEPPTQEEQIRCYQNWVKTEYRKGTTEADALRDITQRNTVCILEILRQRQNPKILEKSQQAWNNLDRLFEKGRTVTLRRLAEYYLEQAKYLDGRSDYIGHDLERLHKISELFFPIPVVSFDGIAEIETLCDLIAEGFVYLGCPLNSRVYFDGGSSGPYRFINHDIFHATYMGNRDDVRATLPILNYFNTKFLESGQDVPLRRLVQFLAFHEKGSSKLMLLYAQTEHKNEDGSTNWRSVCQGILDLAKVSESSKAGVHFVTLYHEYVLYAIEEKIMPPVPNETDRVGALRLADIINAAVDRYKCEFES